MNDEKVVMKLRGLPYSVSEAEVASFLHDVTLREIKFVQKPDGQMSGEAFVLVDTHDAQSVMAHNGKTIGKRFIEIQSSSSEEMEWYLRNPPKPDGTVKLLGLPYEIDKETLRNFFKGLEIVPNGIGLLTDQYGYHTGEAYIQFASVEIAKKALEKDRQKIGSRYVELYSSNLRAATQAIERQMHINNGIDPNTIKPANHSWTSPSWKSQSGVYPPGGKDPSSDQQLLGGRPYASAILEAAGISSYNLYNEIQQQRQQEQQWSSAPAYSYPTTPYYYPYAPGTGYSAPPPPLPPPVPESQPSNSSLHIRMRGLPYTATVEDVIQFFRPVEPLKITLRTNREGKPNGMADVHFASVEDTQEAMKRQRARMGTRYIELFSSSGF